MGNYRLVSRGSTAPLRVTVFFRSTLRDCDHGFVPEHGTVHVEWVTVLWVWLSTVGMFTMMKANGKHRSNEVGVARTGGRWLFFRLLAGAMDSNLCSVPMAWPAQPGWCRCEGCEFVFLQINSGPQSFGRCCSQQERKF